MQIAPVVVTFTNNAELTKPLINSAKQFGWNLEVLLIQGEYPGANKKFKTILESIPRLRASGYTHLISVDAFDTLVLGNMQQFLGKLHDYNFPALILAAEANLFPDKSRLSEYPSTGTRWKFVNSPFIYDLSQPLPNGFADIGDQDDQYHLCNWYLDSGLKDESVILDSKCAFFQTLFGISRNTFANDLRNVETDSYPIFFHGNGHADMSWIPVPTDARVLIGIPSAGYNRYGQFLDYIMNIARPKGTQFAFSHGQSPAQARNQIIQQAINEEYSHVLFIDDDVLVPNDIITRLLAHNVDMVTGLYLLRKWPHQPIVFTGAREETPSVKWRCLVENQNGLVPIDAAGLGCCLIDTKVFKALEHPWITLGDPDPETWCDDVPFFNKARKAGFKAYCDTTLRCGHFSQLIVWPHYQDGKWYTILDTQGIKALNIHQLTQQEFEDAANEQQREELATRAL